MERHYSNDRIWVITVRRGRKLKFGAVLNYTKEFMLDWKGLKKIAQDVEKLGYDSIWFMHHLT